MTNIQTTAAPTLTRASQDHTATENGNQVGHGRRNAILALTAAVTAVAIGGVMMARTGDGASVSPESKLATAVQVRDAYAPGGSVYEQQVPSAPVPADQSAYAPGGSIYRLQVPESALGERSAYAPGGSVYEQQVPAQ